MAVKWLGLTTKEPGSFTGLLMDKVKLKVGYVNCKSSIFTVSIGIILVFV